MKSKFALGFSMILCSLVIVTAATGCSNKTDQTASVSNSSNINTSKAVNLNMLFVGDKVADQDRVFDEINKLAKQDLNCTVNVKNLSWADYVQQYPLVLASGEPMDLVYSSDWMNYFDQARKGAFHEITRSDIETYMPITAAEQSQESFNQAMVNGKLYMIPNYQFEFNVYRVVGIRTDLGKQYDITDVKTVSDFEKYCETIAEKEKGLFPIAYEGSGGNDSYYIFLTQPNQFQQITANFRMMAIRYKDGKFDYENPFNIYETPEFEAYAKLMRSWAEKGFWSRNASSGQGKINDSFVVGKSAVDVWHVGGVDSDIQKINASNPDWTVQIVDLSPTSYKTISKFTNNGVSISVNSKEYERSLMLLEKFKNDQRYLDLSCLGIEGVHWINTGEGTYKEGPDYEKYPIYGVSMWGWMSEKYRRTPIINSSNIKEIIASWRPDVVYPITDDFVFDDTNVKSEYAAITGLMNTFNTTIDLGMAADVNMAIADFQTKLKSAGYDKFLSEYMNQYNAFIAANK